MQSVMENNAVPQENPFTHQPNHTTSPLDDTAVAKLTLETPRAE